MHGHAIGDRIDGLLGELWQAHGTDLLITAGLPPQIRVHGSLHPVAEQSVLTPDDTDALKKLDDCRAAFL